MKKGNHKRSTWVAIMALAVILALLTNSSINAFARFAKDNLVEEIENNLDYEIKETAKVAAFYDYPVHLMKVDSSDQSKKLTGAKFTLKWQSDGEIIEANKEVGSNGVVTFEHIGLGDYIAVEEEAPRGYNKIVGEIQINVGQHGVITAVVNGVSQTGTNIKIKVPNELIYKNPVGKLKTIVSVDGKKGTSGNALTLKPNRIEDITVVTDTIKYEGLVGDKNYTVTGTLNKIDEYGTVTAVATKTETMTADTSGNGE